ncbi:RCC1/BLIP-II protein [Piromyces finnis]|uniref:RCC1/BLIP-II protein n=1 Tax=Piromyces finnis TaxID=1754191 RepID=A0A1Y1UXY4_9FUNG|nr:RCC1/BLIP-II protein [Piromyces finnis]|eukprot:ORX43153.1 RCC1/BLIP-II protein [Piromyces finnis]
MSDIIYKCVLQHDIDQLRSLLKKQPNSKDINYYSSFTGQTPLLLACSLDHRDSLLALIQCPLVNVNLQDLESGYTALHYCLYHGKLQFTIDILKLRRADCNLALKDKEGMTCFDLLNSSFKALQKVKIENEKINIVKNGSSFDVLNTEIINSDIDTDLEDKKNHLSNNSDDNNSDNDYSFSDDSDINKENTDSLKCQPSMSLWTWGSNSNYVLGHNNTDNRTSPESVRLDLPLRNNDKGIHSIQLFTPLIHKTTMSKFHTVVKVGNEVQLCGHGKIGRLGFGNEATQFNLKTLRIDNCQIQNFSVGYNHTLFIGSNGELFTCGDNTFGQLGYETENSVMETMPKEVQSLKNIPIIKASSCKYHNLALARNGTLYSWGLNLGQLGHPAKYDTIKTPKRVSLIIQQDIIDIKTCVTASACLLSSYSVIILVNYTTQKLNFVIPPKPLYQLTAQNFEVSNRKSYLKKKNVQKTKITAIESNQNNNFIALSESGDIYTWKVDIPKSKSNNDEKKIPGEKLKQKSSISNIAVNIGRAAIPGEIAYILNSKETDLVSVSDAYLVYSTERNYMKPLKIAIGIDGNILYSTKFGDAYFGVLKNKSDFKDIALKSNSKFYKFKKIPALQHIVDVFANSSGAYGAIRSDYRPKLIPIIKGTLSEDISDLYQTTANFIDKKLIYDGIYDVIFETSDNIYHYANSAILAARSNYFYELFVLQQYKNNASRIVNANSNYIIKELDNNDKSIKTEVLHEEIIDDIITLFVTKLMSSKNNSLDNIYRNNLFIFSLKDIHSQSLSVLLKFIYSDVFDNMIMKQRYINKNSRKLYEDFITLAKLFECYDSHNKLPTTTYKPTTNIYMSEELTQINNVVQFDYSKQLERMWHDTGLLKLSDVILKLDCNVSLPVHRSILSKRSKFFEVILAMDSIWIHRDKDFDNKIIIDFSHVKMEYMSFILRYIYGDFGVEQFENKFQKHVEEKYKIPCNKLDNYIDLIVEIIILADELMLDEFIDICSRILGSVLDINNVVNILQISEKYNAFKLKASCIQFICSNLITLIENGKIDILDHDVLYEIQESLQQLQNKKFKFTRGENSYYKRIKTMAEEETNQKKLREKSKRQEKKNRKNSTNKEKEKGKEIKIEEELWQPSQEDIQEQILIYQLAMAEQEARKNNNNSSNNTNGKKKKKNAKGKDSDSSNGNNKNSNNYSKIKENKDLYDLSFIAEIQDEIASNSNNFASSSSSLNLQTENKNVNDSNSSINNNKSSKSKKVKYSKLDIFSPESTRKNAWEITSPTNLDTKKTISNVVSASPKNTTTWNTSSLTSNANSQSSTTVSGLASKGWANTVPNKNNNDNNNSNNKKLIEKSENNNNVLSFKEIMKLEQEKENNSSTSSINKPSNSFKGFQKLSQKERIKASKLLAAETSEPTEKVAWGGAGMINKNKGPSILALQHNNETINGSSKKSATKNNAWSNRSFLNIQQEQLKTQKAQQKKLNKSLMQIQTEEKAIEAILSFYKQTSNLENGEWFSVSTL